MILVDTSIWVDHLRVGEPTLAALLDRGRVLVHPWVVGELALGNLRPGSEVVVLLGSLPQAPVAQASEVLHLIEVEHLSGAGIGYADAQLLAATRLATDAALWSRDRRLVEAAARLGVAFDPGSS